MTALDFSRAFDTVNLSILLQRIFSNTSSTNRFQSYLCNRRQAINYGSAISEFKTLTSGIPQDRCLAPTIFIIYLNNMLASINTCLKIAFADDVTVVNVGHTAVAAVSSAESTVADFLTRVNNNGLVLNFAKCQTMINPPVSRKKSYHW